jgi:CRP/FNR family transcriptional regulator, cyclic AMP receptor protein
MAKRSQPADWEAALAGIASGKTVPEYDANRDIFRKQTEAVMANKRIPGDAPAFSKKGKAVMSRTKSQPGVMTANQKTEPVDWEVLLAGINGGKTIIEYTAHRVIFRQGDPADSIFYLQRGKVKLTVTSQQGKEAIVAVLGAGEFFGEGCLAGQILRVSTAVAMTDCTFARIERARMARMLHEQHNISELFVTHLLSRNIRYEEDLVDQLFNSSEKRLARILLLLAHFGKEGRSESVLPRINQENLAQMVGTTRSRVSHFMNKFKKLGFVGYDGTSGGLTVHSGLLSVILHD